MKTRSFIKSLVAGCLGFFAIREKESQAAQVASGTKNPTWYSLQSEDIPIPNGCTHEEATAFAVAMCSFIEQAVKDEFKTDPDLRLRHVCAMNILSKYANPDGRKMFVNLNFSNWEEGRPIIVQSKHYDRSTSPTR